MQFCNQFIWFIIGIVLVCSETCSSNENQVYLVMFIHQWLQLVCFFGYPIAVYIKNTKFKTYTIWYDIFVLVMTSYIVYQNNIKPKTNDSTQTCIVSHYTNKKCHKSDDSFMEDPMYYIGLKSNAVRYSCMYNIYMKLMLVFCIYQIYNRIYVD